MICQGGGTKKSIKGKASSADQVSMNNVLGDKTPCHESEDDLEDVNENSLSLPKSGEAICDPTRLELGINNGDEEFSAGNLKDSPSFEGMHAGGELSLPPWGTMVSENNLGQWTGLASSENSRNRRYVLAKNKMIFLHGILTSRNVVTGHGKMRFQVTCQSVAIFSSHIR